MRYGQTAGELEAQAVWKANELRLAKAREKLLLTHLDNAETAGRQAQAQVRVACHLRFRQGRIGIACDSQDSTMQLRHCRLSRQEFA